MTTGNATMLLLLSLFVLQFLVLYHSPMLNHASTPFYQLENKLKILLMFGKICSYFCWKILLLLEPYNQKVLLFDAKLLPTMATNSNDYYSIIYKLLLYL
jgi:hypothetical protein